MPYSHLKVLFLCVLLIPAGYSQQATADEEVDHNLSEARKLAREFNARLRGKLELAMAEGGPLAAIEVCSTHAPGIAERLQEQHITVKRTSLGLRNPTNAPDQWETRVLTFFDQEKEAGADVTELEHFALFRNEDGEVFRYARAIPTGSVCLICHGENIAPDIAEALDAAYPADAAKGYKLGQVRGMVSITIREPR
ncbi:MAG: DUF3365 domain-containing protein [Gammaproteobacteria bacterium]|nr:DUF3365 domain-containing protein [Gammaproteobacteria bacterium]